MNNNRFSVLIGMVFIAFASRLIPHPPNFTPIAALALFGGASFADKRAALLVPLCGLFFSDLVLGFYAAMPVVYGSFALVVCIGFGLRQRQTIWRIGGATVGAAALFFVLSNFGEWALGAIYPRTLNGLVDCFVAAIPFFRNTILGDLMYSAVLFGGLSFAEHRWPSLAEATPTAT